MKNNDEILLIEAIENANFENFFSLISKVNSSYERYKFTLQCIAVAKYQKNSNILKHFLKIEFDRWELQQLFSEILKALVELNEIDTAFGIVIRNENKNLEMNEGWYLLAKALLTQIALDEIKNIIDYIKEDYQKADIIKSCLTKIALPTQVLIWLEWFELYTSIEMYVNLNFDAVILALADYPDFNLACVKLQKIKPSVCKQQLLRQLYLYLLTKRELEKLNELNAILPNEMHWLVKIPQTLTDEKQFYVLTNLEYQEAIPFIGLALENLLIRKQHDSDEDLVESINNAANLSERYRELIVEKACDICLINLKVNVVVKLLPVLDKCIQTNMIKALLRHDLSTLQYQFILSQLDSFKISDEYLGYIFNEEEIIKKFPPQLIAKEYQHRVQVLIAESHDKFFEINAIHEEHPQYQTFINMIDQLLEYKQYDMALKHCLKLVPSENRDVYLIEFLQHAFELSNFSDAEDIAQLLFQINIRLSVNHFLYYYQILNYREALKYLIKLNDKIPLPNLILNCASAIFAKNNSIAATHFLIDEGIFDLSENGSDADSNKIIKRKIMSLIVVKHRNDENLLKFIKSLKQGNINEFKFYLFEELLTSNYFLFAIKLLNICLDKTPYGKRLHYGSEKLEEKITEYVEKLEPSIDILNTLAQLEEESLQITLFSKLFRNIHQNLSSSKISMIAAIPNEELKIDYLIKTIVFCIEKNSFSLAKQALAWLSKNVQCIWSKIIFFAEQDQITSILNIILNESITEENLLYWTIKKWLAATTSNNLLTTLLNFHRPIKEIRLERSNFVSDIDNLYKLLAKQRIYEILISQVFLHWHKLLVLSKNYLEFLSGMESLLLLAEDFKSYIDLFSPLRNIIKILVNEKYYEETLAALQLLIKYEENSFSYFFEEIFSIILKNNALVFAERALALLQGKPKYWLEKILIMVSEAYSA